LCKGWNFFDFEGCETKIVWGGKACATRMIFFI
jgi:hypothetical protein